jgi:hypothetical protein
MESERKELWHRLENEPANAFRAFERYLSLPSSQRTLTAAYQHYVGNPDARPSDTWVGWSRTYAWASRVAAYDDHLASLRRDACERGIEAEAEQQGVLAERNRNRMNEMLTLSYERATQWFEHTQPSDLRAQDVLAIVRLHMDYLKAFEATETHREEVTWTEEDDAELEQVIREIEAEGKPKEGSKEGEEDSEDTEGVQD